MKKDTKIAFPPRVQNPFRLRKEELSHEDQFLNDLEGLTDVQKMIQTTYSYVRDFPSILRNDELRESIREKFMTLLENEKETFARRVQLAVFLESQLGYTLEKHSVKEFVRSVSDFAPLVNAIEILAFQKKVLVAVRKFRDDWEEVFSSIFHLVDQNQLRDYMLKELEGPETINSLKKILIHLLQHPEKNPHSFVWYFQKVIHKEGLPLGDIDGKRQFLEAILILLHKLETKRVARDLRKKIYTILSAKRFEIVRSLIQGASVGYLKEFLLLVTKCQTLTDHDIKILYASAEAVQPSLAKRKKKGKEKSQVIWTTEEGHVKLQELIKKTHSDVRENSKEVEAARALGDLRENFEFKAAKERQAQLQNELKQLAEQSNRVRVLSEKDVSTEKVGVGVKAEVSDSKGNTIIYTILGPWDAIPEEYILSFQSERAKLMEDCSVGDNFTFRGEEYTVKSIKSIFEE